MADIIRFHTADGLVGAGVKLDPRQILEAALEDDFHTVIVIAVDDSNKIRVRSTDGLAESILLMERAKHSIL